MSKTAPFIQKRKKVQALWVTARNRAGCLRLSKKLKEKAVLMENAEWRMENYRNKMPAHFEFNCGHRPLL